MKDKILKTKAEESYWNSDAHGGLSSKKNYVLGFIDGAKELEEENKQLAKRICELQSDLSKEKDTIDKLLDFVADRVEECDVCELADTCIREGICPFGVSHRNIKTLIKNYIRQQ